MNIVAQLKTIQAGLAPFATRHGASVTLAHDPAHLFQIMTAAPGTVRLGLLVVGEEPRNATWSDVVGLQDREFWIALSRGYTLEAYPGKSLIEGVAGGRPLFELLDELRAPVRALRFDAPEPAPYYHGFKLLTFDGIRLDAYYLRLVVASDPGNEPMANLNVTEDQG